MSKSTYFVQVCPTCGRTLHIRVAYLGKLVICQHCQGQLMASDSETAPASLSDSAIMRRAEELLEMAEQRKSRPR